MLTSAQQEGAMRLWDELADFSASQTDEALQHLMQKFCEWLRADDVVWVGAARLLRGPAARRDMMLGWRAVARRSFKIDPARAENADQAARSQDTDPGMTSRALAEGVGKFRIHRLHDGFVDIAAFKESSHYRAFYLANRIQDRLFIGFPIHADAESFLLFDRMDNPIQFTPEDVELVEYAMRGLRWFHREVMLSHGLLLASQPLNGMERRIVSLLLTDRTEKEIAATLGQSPKTTHQYITEIFRKFNVRGRTGLMAVWLGRERS